MNQHPKVITPAQCHALLVKASQYDGRREESLGRENIKAWHEVAVMQRWTDFETALAAITDYYGRPAKPGDRLWIMPGHVTAYIQTQKPSRAPVDEELTRQERRCLEIEQARPAPDETKAAAIREIAEILSRKKILPTDKDEPERSPEEIAEAKRAAREELRRRRWQQVDDCKLCDDEGMCDDGRVCLHQSA
jgi:hypothetical protein